MGLAATASMASPPMLQVQDTSPINYVAMGDSYSAGVGNLPLDLTAPPQCLRSTVNYANNIMRATGANLTDVTCGGATTADFTASQGVGIPAQLDAVNSSTQLVTMTIGGNNSGVFGDLVNGCAAQAALTLGQGNPCEQRYGSTFTDTVLNVTYPEIVAALNAVKAKAAPKAQIAIVGYPWIAPKAGGCYPALPFASGDIPYIRGIQATLNDAVRRAAATTKVTYVDMNDVSNGHDACEAPGVRWVEPAITLNSAALGHPNALGESEMAAQIRRVLNLP